MSTGLLAIRNLSIYDHLLTNGPQIQCVRWRRKPIWLPTAKSKMFRIPKKPVLSVEETEELKRLNNNYKTYMKSLRNYFVMQDKINTIQFDPEKVKAQRDEDFLKCNKINARWNKHVAEEREERYAVKRENRRLEIMMKLEAKKERDSKLLEKIEVAVKKAKEEETTFITSENIDEAIERALENIVDHNFAIDTEGNAYTDDGVKSLQVKKTVEATV